MTSPVEETFQQALAAMQKGDAKAAEPLFKQVLQSQPGHVASLNLLSIVLTGLGRFEEAEHYVRLALNVNATSDVTFYNYGLILKALKRPVEAVQRFGEALKINASVAETWNMRGTVFNDLKRHREAVADFDRAIAINANYRDAVSNKAGALVELGLYREALAAYDGALALKPDLPETWFGRGNVLDALKQYDDAAAAYERALTLNPGLIGAWLGRGNVCTKLKQYDNALAAYGKALALRSDLAEAWFGFGIVHGALGQYDDAFDAYDKALVLRPDLAGAWLGRGNMFAELRQHDNALAAYDKALALKPDLAEAEVGRGNVYIELKQINNALAAFDRALAARPDLAEAWLGRGNVLTEIRQPDNALAAYDKALALAPGLAEAWLGRGNVLADILRQHDNALTAYDKALALAPGLAEAWLGRGNVFTELRNYDEAFVAYDRALSLRPDLKYVEGDRLQAKLHLADWANLEAEVAHLVSAVRDRKPASRPFVFVAIPSSPADQLQCAKSFVADAPRFPAIWRGEIYRHDRIRIAYLSADFHQHATAYLMAGLFERHDKTRFETTAISFGPDQDSEMRRRMKGAFEQFVDVRRKSDHEIAELIRQLEIDIAVDLKGFTNSGRYQILARRPAPIQVNYLGYPGTIGADYIDYIIADATMIPESQFPFYSERVVWLPDSYQVNDRQRPIAEKSPTRRECALPEGALVLCCFNAAFKVLPDIFDIWMRLLQSNENSVLWLFAEHATASANLQREAEQRGIAPDRLIFAPRMPQADHLARHRHADLILDTLPCNAHTTASDALWAGVPVLTCLGSTFAGRVAGSLLRAVGLDELVTSSLQDYEALALKLIQDPAYLASLKDRLARHRMSYPLFDTERTTRHIEAAYTTMWQRQQSGEMPRAFAAERMS